MPGGHGRAMKAGRHLPAALRAMPGPQPCATCVVRPSACMGATGMAWAAPASPRAAMKANAMVFFMDVLLCSRARIVVEAAGGGRYNGKCVGDRRTLREPQPANLIHEPVGWVERKRNPSCIGFDATLATTVARVGLPLSA